MKYLITGGCGFLGSNIASELLKQGHGLVIFDNLYRFGSYQNLEWLKSQGDFEFLHGDIRNTNDVERTIRTHKPDVIYHLAGQVAMTTSIADPRMDFEVNVDGSFNLLNAVRLYSPESIIVYSSTNKVYGDLEQFSYREAETRYECIDKPNGFTQKAVEIKKGTATEPFTISGTGKQVRDLLYASDCVSLYLKAAENIDKIKGEAFNIGGGIENSSSLLELFSFLEQELDIAMNYTQLPPRESDQRVFVADNSKAQSLIGWKPEVNKALGIRKMIDWVANN